MLANIPMQFYTTGKIEQHLESPLTNEKTSAFILGA